MATEDWFVFHCTSTSERLLLLSNSQISKIVWCGVVWCGVCVCVRARDCVCVCVCTLFCE